MMRLGDQRSTWLVAIGCISLVACRRNSGGTGSRTVTVSRSSRGRMRMDNAEQRADRAH